MTKVEPIDSVRIWATSAEAVGGTTSREGHDDAIGPLGITSLGPALHWVSQGAGCNRCGDSCATTDHFGHVVPP